MHKIIITTTAIKNSHHHNNHCSLHCGSSLGSRHPQRMLNCTGLHSSKAARGACPLIFHEQSSQCSCFLNWSHHRSIGCIAPTDERVRLHEQRVDGDELLGLETLQDGSPTPKLSGHAGVGGSLTRGPPHSQMSIGGSKCRRVAVAHSRARTTRTMARTHIYSVWSVAGRWA